MLKSECVCVCVRWSGEHRFRPTDCVRVSELQLTAGVVVFRLESSQRECVRARVRSVVWVRGREHAWLHARVVACTHARMHDRSAGGSKSHSGKRQRSCGWCVASVSLAAM